MCPACYGPVGVDRAVLGTVRGGVCARVFESRRLPAWRAGTPVQRSVTAPVGGSGAAAPDLTQSQALTQDTDLDVGVAEVLLGTMAAKVVGVQYYTGVTHRMCVPLSLLSPCPPRARPHPALARRCAFSPVCLHCVCVCVPREKT